MAQRGKFLFFARAKKKRFQPRNAAKKEFLRTPESLPVKRAFMRNVLFYLPRFAAGISFFALAKKEIFPSVQSLSLSVSLW